MISLVRRIITRKGVTLIKQQQYRTMASGYLIDDPKYSFLKDLGLEKTNCGVYNGKWSGSGPVNIFF